MKAKNEELLYHLLWTCERLSQPTFRNLTDSFEQWAYRAGLTRQLAELQKRKFIERETTGSGSKGASALNRAIRLTEVGRRLAFGGVDPEERWSPPWDGLWRLAIFDIPNEQATVRGRLRRYLRKNGFGCLQQSVWVSPHKLETEKKLLADAKVDVKSLLLLDASPSAGETDEEIVNGAWDFTAINRAYAEYRLILAARPKEDIENEAQASVFQAWTKRERSAWIRVAELDPYLPLRLLPQGYLGRVAWRERMSVMKAAGKQMRAFRPKANQS